CTRQPSFPLRADQSHLLAEGDGVDRLLPRPWSLVASVDRPAQLSARADLERAAGARPPDRLWAVRRPFRPGDGCPDLAAAAEIHRRVSRDPCRLLCARPDPLAALGLPLRVYALRARAVL